VSAASSAGAEGNEANPSSILCLPAVVVVEGQGGPPSLGLLFVVLVQRVPFGEDEVHAFHGGPAR